MRKGIGTGQLLGRERSVSVNGNVNGKEKETEKETEKEREIREIGSEIEKGSGRRSEITRSLNASASAICIIFSSSRWYSRDTGTLHHLININMYILSLLQANHTITSPDHTTTIALTITMFCTTTTEPANLKEAQVVTLPRLSRQEVQDPFAALVALANMMLQAALTLIRNLTHTHTLSLTLGTTNTPPR
jgi:hypothetical protein